MRFDVFLRSFLSIGFLLTVSGVVRQALRGVPLDASFILPIAGLSMLAALPLAGLWAWAHDEAVEAAVWIVGAPNGDGPARRPVNVRERITVPLPPEQALRLCRAAVEQAPGVKDVRLDSPATLRARVGATLRSCGERIRCSVRAVDGGSEVEIHSQPRVWTTLLDFGKNGENVDCIRAALEKLVHQSGPPGLLADPRNELTTSAHPADAGEAAPRIPAR